FAKHVQTGGPDVSALGQSSLGDLALNGTDSCPCRGRQECCCRRRHQNQRQNAELLLRSAESCKTEREHKKGHARRDERTSRTRQADGHDTDRNTKKPDRTWTRVPGEKIAGHNETEGEYDA